jgi:uncharacterized protein YbjQ (UPF0145 family)
MSGESPMSRTKLSIFPAAIAGLTLLTAPALAQTPVRSAAQIVLTEGEAPAAHTVVGDVRAEAHQTSLFAKVSGRDMVDQQLREKALQMGADAVIGIKYENNNPMFSKKGFIATGKAVKFTNVAVASVPPALAAAPSFSATGAPSAVPLAAPPVVAAAAAPQPAPAAVVMLPGVVPILEGAAPWAHTVVGPVRAEIHQKSLMPKTPSRDLADQELRAQAQKLGADAVVNVKYESNNPMFSTKGFVATGTAVKLAAAAPAPAPALAAAPPPAQVAVAPPAPAPVQIPAAPPAAAPVAPPAAAAAAPAAGAVVATVPAAIVLSEQNVTRAYAVLGPVNAELDPAALSLEKTGRQVLDEELRKQAAKLGADAVILVRYTASASGKGPAAIGVAVKYN